MALYGPSSIARVLPEHGRDARFLKRKGIVGGLLSPPAWTRAYAWKPAASCCRDAKGDGWESNKSLMVSRSLALQYTELLTTHASHQVYSQSIDC